MNDAPYAHIGVLVHNIQEAIERYSRLGLTFMEPHTVEVGHLADEDGQIKQIELRIAFSQEGPPHWELLQAVGDGIYGPHHVGTLHHVAVLAGNPIARREGLVRQGFREVAAQ